MARFPKTEQERKCRIDRKWRQEARDAYRRKLEIMQRDSPAEFEQLIIEYEQKAATTVQPAGSTAQETF